MGVKTVVLLMILALALTHTNGLSRRAIMNRFRRLFLDTHRSLDSDQLGLEGGSTLTLDRLADELHEFERHLMGKNKMEMAVLNSMAERTLEFLCGMVQTLLKERGSTESDDDDNETGEINSPPDSARRELITRILEAVQDKEESPSGSEKGPLLSKICPLLRDMPRGPG